MAASIYAPDAVAIPFLEMASLVKQNRVALVIDRKTADKIVQSGAIDQFSKLGYVYRYAYYFTILVAFPVACLAYLYGWWLMILWPMIFAMFMYITNKFSVNLVLTTCENNQEFYEGLCQMNILHFEMDDALGKHYWR